jgi:hypothetical protein
MKDKERIEKAIKDYVGLKREFFELNIVTSERGLISEIGEWLVETIFDGKRARNKVQADWDVMVNGKKIQVKTHAKALSNKAARTTIKYAKNAQIDKVIIIVFTPSLKLKQFYIIPWKLLYKKIRLIGGKSQVYWKDLTDFKQPINCLPKQEIVSIF